MLEEIIKQQKEELLTLMLKNELAEMWLSKKIAETPKKLKDTKDIETLEEEVREQYNKYITFVGNLERVLEAKTDNLFNLEHLDKAVENIKEYV